MAIKTAMNFGITFIGDGTHNSITISASTAPLLFAPSVIIPGSPAISQTFSIVQTLPTAVSNLFSSDSQVVTVTIGILGLITFSWPNAIPNGDVVTVYGVFHF